MSIAPYLTFVFGTGDGGGGGCIPMTHIFFSSTVAVTDRQFCVKISSSFTLRKRCAEKFEFTKLYNLL